MKLSVRYWNNTLRKLGLRWVAPAKKKRRKHSQAHLDFGALEPRKLLARGHAPPPAPDPDPVPPPVITGPETTEDDIVVSVVSDIVPDIHVETIEPVDDGMLVDGDWTYQSPLLTGTVSGDFTTYPRVLIQFDLEAADAQILGNLHVPDAFVIIEDPASDPIFQLDPVNPANVGAYNPFEDSPGWKVIGYRILPIDENGEILVDAEDRILASPWQNVGFQLIDPAEGPVRVVDVGLANDTDVPGDMETHDPRVEVAVHGEFLASQSYRLEFEYPFNGQVLAETIDVPAVGTVEFEPLVNNPALAYEAMTVNLTYRLMSSSDGGTTWNQLSSSQFSFDNLLVLEASVGELSEDLGDSPYRGGDRLVNGWLDGTVQDSTVPYLVEVEIGIPDENGAVTYHADGETTARYDETNERFEFAQVLVDAESATEVRARVKQWVRGEYKYSPWVVTSVQEPQPFDLGSVAVEEEPEQDDSQQRGPGLAPKIVGYLDGAPTVDALEDNSETEDPLDYRELSDVRVEFYFGDTAPDENSIADDHVQSDAFGHFAYRPDSLALGANQIWARTVLELSNGQKYFGPAQSVAINIEAVELPALSIELLDDEATEVTDETTGATHWSTADPRISATLTTTDTSLYSHQVAIEFAHDNPNVADDESEIVGRTFAYSEDKATYYPFLLGQEGETVKIRARLAYYHPQLGEEVHTDWVELSVQLQQAIHEPSIVSELDVLGSQEKNASDEPIVRGDSAWIAGEVTHPNGLSGSATVQFRDVSTGTVLGQTTTSAAGRFIYSMDDLALGAQQIEAVVLDWNYQTSAVEAGPASALTFEVQEATEILVNEFQLHSDTGSSGSDDVTSNPTLVGKLLGDGNLAGTRVALTRNDGHEVIVTADSTGRFIYRSEDLSSGQSYTYQARVATWDSISGTYSYGTPADADVTFQYQTETGFRAKVGIAGLADTSTENFDSATGVVRDLTLRGRIFTAGELDGITVEVDFNGDGTVDRSVRTDRFGEFVIVAGSLAAGTMTPQIRVNETGYDAEAWVVLPTFDYQPPVESIPEITSFTQLATDSIRLTGSISSDSEYVIVDILVEHEGQDIVVAQIAVDEQGNFEYEVPDAQAGEVIQFKARARSGDSGRWNWGEISTTTFQYLPATYVDQVSLKADTVTGGTGTVTDGVTDDSAILVQVAGAGDASTVSLEIQRDGGEVETVDLPVLAGLGEYIPADLSFGYHSLRVRVAGNDDAPWQQINYIFETDTDRADSLELAQQLTELNPNWKTENYESEVSSDEDFDFQLTQAEDSHAAEVQEASDLLEQQKLTAEALYQGAIRNARLEFEANVPESLRRFRVDPFSWPDDPATKPVEVLGLPTSHVIPTDGPDFDLSKDRQYNLETRNANTNFSTQQEQLQSGLKSDLESAESGWETDLKNFKTTRRADLKTAYQDYQTALDTISQDTSEFAEIQERLRVASETHQENTSRNSALYRQLLLALDAQNVIDMNNLKLQEEALLPAPRSNDWLAIRTVLEQFSPVYREIYTSFHEKRFQAKVKWYSDDAKSLETYENAKSKADADTARLELQLKHEKFAAKQEHWLQYKTKVAEIHREYTEAVATRTETYRKLVAEKHQGYEHDLADATQVRDDALSTAHVQAVSRWANGLATTWGTFQKQLAESQDIHQRKVNLANRNFARNVADLKFDLATGVAEARKNAIVGVAAVGDAEAVIGQAEIAETLAVELATAAKKMKVDASFSRTERDKELATQWQDRRDDWSKAGKEQTIDDVVADKEHKLTNAEITARFHTELVHPSYYGRTTRYTQFSLIAHPQTFSFKMHTQAEFDQLLEGFNEDLVESRTTYLTKLKASQKKLDDALISADKDWRRDSSSAYHDALNQTSTSELEASGWYHIRDLWKTEVQNAKGKFSVDMTASNGVLGVEVAKLEAQSKVDQNVENDNWKNAVLTDLVGAVPSGTNIPLEGSKWFRDLEAFGSFRASLIQDAFNAGKMDVDQRNRETTRANDLVNSRRVYLQELAAEYWVRRLTRQQANGSYTNGVYGPEGAYVSQAQTAADAENNVAEQKLEFQHQIALSNQEKTHDSQVADELLEFHHSHANEIARRAGRIVVAIYDYGVALIPNGEFSQYTGSITYFNAPGVLGGTHAANAPLVYLRDAAARDAASETAEWNQKRAFADANKDFEIDLASARQSLVKDLGVVDLNDANAVKTINNDNVAAWSLDQIFLATSNRNASVEYQEVESTEWASSRISHGEANEAFAVAEAEIGLVQKRRDAVIEQTYLIDATNEVREKTKQAHENHVAALETIYSNAVSATAANATVENKKAEALAKFQWDTAAEEFSQWTAQRVEKERYEAEVRSLNLARQTSIEDADIQLLKDSRIYFNRMVQADGTTLVLLPEEINRDFEIDRSEVLGDLLVGQVETMTWLLTQQTAVQGQLNVDLMTAATVRDDAYAGVEYDYVEAVATAVWQEQYTTIDLATLASTRVTAGTEREAERQTILDDYEADVSSTQHSALESLGQKRVTFVKDYTQKHIDFVNEVGAVYVLVDSGANAFEAARVERTNVAKVTHTQEVTQARIDFATDSLAKALVHQANQRAARVASTGVLATANADYHQAVAQVDLDQATTALGISGDEALTFEKDKAEVTFDWLTAMEQAYVNFKTATAGSSADFVVGIVTAAGTRKIATVNAQSSFERDEQTASNRRTSDQVAADTESVSKFTENKNTLELAQATADKLLAEDLIAAEVARDNALDAIDRNSSLSPEEKAAQRLQVEETYKLDVATAHRNRLVRTASDGVESGRAIAWNKYQKDEAARVKTWEDANADAEFLLATTLSAKSKTLTEDVGNADANYEYDSWIAKGEYVKRNALAERSFDTARFETLDNLNIDADSLTSLELSAMVEVHARSIIAVAGLQLIDQMFDAHETMAEKERDETILSTDQVAVLTKASVDGDAETYREFAKKRAKYQFDYLSRRANAELVYDRAVATAKYEEAISQKTPEEAGQVVSEAEETYREEVGKQLKLRDQKTAIANLREIRAISASEKELADSVALEGKELAEKIATARYGVNGLVSTLANLDYQLQVLDASSRPDAFLQLFDLADLLTFSGSIDPANPNAAIQAWLPYLYAEAVAEESRASADGDAEKLRKLDVAAEDLKLANKTTELTYKKVVAGNAKKYQETNRIAKEVFDGWEDRVKPVELPSGFAEFDDEVLELSKVELGFDEAITSWSIAEKRWFRGRGENTTWYEGTETSIWRDGDPRKGENDNLSHRTNRDFWLGDIDGHNDVGFLEAIKNSWDTVSEWISELNWEAFEEWITEAWIAHVEIQLAEQLAQQVEEDTDTLIEYNQWLEKIGDAFKGFSSLSSTQFKAFNDAGLITSYKSWNPFYSSYYILRLGSQRFIYAYDLVDDGPPIDVYLKGPHTYQPQRWELRLVKFHDNLEAPDRVLLNGLYGRTTETYLTVADVLISIIPGGTSAGHIEEGNYGAATRSFAQDVALSISLVGKPAQAIYKLGRVSKFAKLAKIGVQMQRLLKIGGESRAVNIGLMVANGYFAVSSGYQAVQYAEDGEPISATMHGIDALFSAIGLKGVHDFAKVRRQALEAKIRLEGLGDDVRALINNPDFVVSNGARAISRQAVGEAFDVQTGLVHKITFKDLSPSAKRIVQLLKKQTRIKAGAEVSIEDLRKASMFLDRELGVARNNGRLFIVRGERKTVSFRPSDRPLVHTHPTFVTKEVHFRDYDIPNADDFVEAVVDWGGTITHFNKTGIIHSPEVSPIVNGVIK